MLVYKRLCAFSPSELLLKFFNVEELGVVFNPVSESIIAKLAQLAAMPTVPPFIMGLMTEESQRLELLDDLRGLMTVLIALLSRFGVLLKLNARLTAMRVFDASLAALLRVPEAKSPVSISS